MQKKYITPVLLAISSLVICAAALHGASAHSNSKFDGIFATCAWDGRGLAFTGRTERSAPVLNQDPDLFPFPGPMPWPEPPDPLPLPNPNPPDPPDPGPLPPDPEPFPPDPWPPIVVPDDTGTLCQTPVCPIMAGRRPFGISSRDLEDASKA